MCRLDWLLNLSWAPRVEPGIRTIGRRCARFRYRQIQDVVLSAVVTAQSLETSAGTGRAVRA